MEAPKIKFGFADLNKAKKLEKTVVLPVFNTGKDKFALPKAVNTTFKLDEKNIAKILKAASFEGKSGQIHLVHELKGVSAERVIFLGLGKADEQCKGSVEKAGASLLDKAKSLKQDSLEVVVALDEDKKNKLSDADIAYHLAVGLTLKSYSFNDHKFKTKEKDTVDLKKVTITLPKVKEAKERISEFEKIAKGLFWTRTLVNEPANVLYPKAFVDRIKDKFKGTPVKVTAIGEKELKKMGANLILSVGNSAESETYMVILEYDGRVNKKGKSEPIAFVGKGVCFDTGGNSMKPAASMMGMHMDMGGAGVVVGLFHSLVERKAKIHVVGAVGLVENMVGGNATRPNDIVTSLSGQTVEILNTDAEGRLVLADVLWYVQEKFKPKKLIDLATLTGAIIVSLGGEYAGLFSNTDRMVEELKTAGDEVREPVWHMPLCKAYDKAIDSHIADMKNIGTASGGGGSATAAAFLQRYIKDGVEWTHLDIAGVMMEHGGWYVGAKGATGFGVRLLNQWLKNTAE